MTAATAPERGPRGRVAGAVRRCRVPGCTAVRLQAVTIAVVLLMGGTQVVAARADLAADNGAGPPVAVPATQRLAAPPVTLGIPSLGITNRLVGLRKANNGTLGVPTDSRRAGWYSQGAAPGDPGPAVIVGHVDSYRGPGIFHRIDRLQRGDLIKVRRADGTLVTFVVQQVRDYPKRSFPTALVYGGDRRPSLRLITCGGAFDRRSKHYLSNTIVFASLQAPRSPARKPPAPRA